MEQIFFLVLVAAVALIRWVLQVAENKKNAEAAKRAGPQPSNAPLQRAPAQTEEERIRRFMEALGVPTSTPPPKVERRQIIPKIPPGKRQILPVDPFPIPRGGPPPPPTVIASPPITQPVPEIPALPTRETTVLAPPPPTRQERTAPEFEVQNFEPASAEPGPESATFGTLVRQKPAGVEQGLAARLATAEGLRDAIVLREIFGPPRSMQPLDVRPSYKG